MDTRRKPHLLVTARTIEQSRQNYDVQETVGQDSACIVSIPSPLIIRGMICTDIGSYSRRLTLVHFGTDAVVEDECSNSDVPRETSTPHRHDVLQFVPCARRPFRSLKWASPSRQCEF
jgi:hypothetical protein